MRSDLGGSLHPHTLQKLKKLPILATPKPKALARKKVEQ
jgi:hypothetical protein